jgi:YlmC/YmxH family sporulation protein
MERLSTCELREKDVVNVCDGAILGSPCDFEFDLKEGRITALILPKPSGFLGLCRKNDLIIPWCRIECIGEDTILVKIPPSEYRDNECEKKKRYFYL